MNYFLTQAILKERRETDRLSNAQETFRKKMNQAKNLSALRSSLISTRKESADCTQREGSQSFNQNTVRNQSLAIFKADYRLASSSASQTDVAENVVDMKVANSLRGSISKRTANRSFINYEKLKSQADVGDDYLLRTSQKGHSQLVNLEATPLFKITRKADNMNITENLVVAKRASPMTAIQRVRSELRDIDRVSS